MTTAQNLWSKTKDIVRRALGEESEVPVESGTTVGDFGNRPAVQPPVDIFEGEQELVIVADVPGAQRKDTMVFVDDHNVVTLRASVTAGLGGGAWISEFRPQDWARCFRVPHGFAGNRAKAHLDSGVLTVRIPRRKESPPTRIRVS